VSHFPKVERGFYHLTGEDWIRKDCQPFPQTRVETWEYELEYLEDDVKQRVSLTRTWVQPPITPQAREALHARFGEPVAPSHERNLHWHARPDSYLIQYAFLRPAHRGSTRTTR
jgi:hypothetical protein